MWDRNVLKQWKDETGVTLKEIADAVGMSESGMSRYVNGHVAKPNIETLAAIAAFFERPLTDLLTTTEKPEEKVRRPRARMTREAAA